MVGKALTNKGATVRVWSILYKTVVHSVLLYGSKSWVVMGSMLKVLEVLDNRVARNIVGMWDMSNQIIYTVEADHRSGAGGILDHIFMRWWDQDMGQ